MREPGPPLGEKRFWIYLAVGLAMTIALVIAVVTLARNHPPDCACPVTVPGHACSCG